MPILHSIIHKIDKKPDGSPAILHCSVSELAESQARDELVNQSMKAITPRPARLGASSKGKNGRKANDYFRDFIDCQEGVDGHRPFPLTRRP